MSSRIIQLSNTAIPGVPDVSMGVDELKTHAAFLGGTGSGKTTLALSAIEQALAHGIPCIMVDRKGDLAPYGAGAGLNVPAASRDRWDTFMSKVEPVVYTPGHTGGFPVSIPLAPADLFEMDETDRKNATNAAAHALGDMLQYTHKGRDAEARAILFAAMDLLVQTSKPLTIPNLIEYLRRQSPKFLEAIAVLDLGTVGKVIKDLGVFTIDKGRVLIPTAKSEPLSMDTLLGKDSKSGKTRLSIISTKFLGHASLFWVAQLLIEAGRWSSKNPSNKLQALLFLDEADAYAPARHNPATKEPLENLLKRGRSAGLGVLLATQSPGDLDYKLRDNVRTWCLGRIREKVALGKIAPMVQDDEVLDRIATQTTGQFVVTTEGRNTAMVSLPSMMQTKQQPEDVILALARKTRRNVTPEPEKKEG